MTAFDTLKLADRLESAGFTPQQARGTATALSEALTADLATKGDLSEVRQALKADIIEVRGEISELRSELKAEVTILKWIGGFMLALLVAIAIKLFVH